MQEIDVKEVVNELRKHTVARKLTELRPEIPIYGFRHNGESDFIATFSDISESELGEFRWLLADHFGGPLKDFDEPIVIGSNVPKFYVDYLNRMHGNTMGSSLLKLGIIDLYQLVLLLETRSGNEPTHPPVNLTTTQAFYGHRPDPTAVEIVRICPWNNEPTNTLEYMVSVRSVGSD